MKDLVIIGAGPAGLTAGMYAARRNLSCIILEAGAIGGQLLTASIVENYPGFPEPLSGSELAERMRKQTENHGIEIKKENAKTIEKTEKGFGVVCTEGERIESRTIIIGTGAAYRRLNIKNENEFIGKGISYCPTCDGPLYKGKTVAVVGGGSSAITSALYLESIAKKVYLIHRRREMRAEEVLVKKLESSGIECLWDTVVDEADGEDRIKSARLKNIKTGEEKELELDGVFVEIGAVPCTELTKSCGIKTDETGYIIANNRQETSEPGIYAAGDVTGRVKQIGVAVGDATVAVMSICEYLKSKKGPVV